MEGDSSLDSLRYSKSLDEEMRPLVSAMNEEFASCAQCHAPLLRPSEGRIGCLKCDWSIGIGIPIPPEEWAERTIPSVIPVLSPATSELPPLTEEEARLDLVVFMRTYVRACHTPRSLNLEKERQLLDAIQTKLVYLRGLIL